MSGAGERLWTWVRHARLARSPPPWQGHSLLGWWLVAGWQASSLFTPIRLPPPSLAALIPGLWQRSDTAKSVAAEGGAGRRGVEKLE